MAHIHKLIDYTVEVFIVYQNKVLLIFHKKLNKWLPIGGHIELDEDPEEALIRETKEESGLDIEVYGKKPKIIAEDVKFLYNSSYLDIHKISDNHRHVGMIYFAKSKSSEITLKKDEHKQIKWFSKRDLEESRYRLQTDVKFYAQRALAILTT